MTRGPLPEADRARAVLAAYVSGMSCGRQRFDAPPQRDGGRGNGYRGRERPLHELALRLGRFDDVQHMWLCARLIGLATRFDADAQEPARRPLWLHSRQWPGAAAGAPVERACLAGVLLGLTRPADPIADLVAEIGSTLEDGLATLEQIQLEEEASADDWDDEMPDQPPRADPGLAALEAEVGELRGLTGLRDVVTLIAAAVSAGLSGATAAQTVSLSVWAADEAAADMTDYRPGPQLSARIPWACALAEQTDSDPLEVVALLVGNSVAPQECVPAAFAIAATNPQVTEAQRAAERLGGQSTTIAALAGALVAARTPPDPDGLAGLDPRIGRLADLLLSMRARAQAKPS